MFRNDKIPPDEMKTIRFLCGKCREHLVNLLDSTLAETGKIKGNQIHFANITDKWSIGSCGMRITQSFKGDDIRALEIYATFPDDSGYEMKNFMFHGTNSQIIDYLCREEFIDEVIEIYDHFSENIRDKI